MRRNLLVLACPAIKRKCCPSGGGGCNLNLLERELLECVLRVIYCNFRAFIKDKHTFTSVIYIYGRTVPTLCCIKRGFGVVLVEEGTAALALMPSIKCFPEADGQMLKVVYIRRLEKKKKKTSF